MIKKINKKAKIIIALAIIAALLLGIAISSYVLYNQKYKETEIISFNEDGYLLNVVEVGKLVNEDGSRNYCFKLIKDEKTVNTYSFTISNNDEPLDEDNFEVSWLQDNIRIIVSASGQNDLIYFLNYNSFN